MAATTHETTPDRRVSWPLGIRRGLACRCPACGEGRAFRGFLKVADACEACGQELHHHRADDLPPYVTIFIVGHIVGYGILLTETNLDWPLWLTLSIWPALTLAMTLALMQPVKGAVVGLQYALGMHGFGAGETSDAQRTG
ncbi:DUF983 domain-containing protein [Salinarimonas ramus]|uniref:DUF983 domain-containing protein n=1 Tax=Salinarimonas ramus TaxID=690164 RepID=A0A917V321_9HYPH|nr:DUF983 domain-containing protein [Salinarimonas ramus]GGK27425.1 hypothetical protein GCM10011322_12450 [Salinarimonas ramus]